MNTPETINIEKYAEALNDLIGVDSAYMAGDKSVDAIVEVIVAAKKLENRVKELTEENDRLRESNAGFALAHLFDVSPNGDCWDEIIKQTKTDVIKKMQERLKEKGYIPKPYGVSKVIDEYDIDQVTKEMLEVNNE